MVGATESAATPRTTGRSRWLASKTKRKTPVQTHRPTPRPTPDNRTPDSQTAGSSPTAAKTIKTKTTKTRTTKTSKRTLATTAVSKISPKSPTLVRPTPASSPSRSRKSRSRSLRPRTKTIACSTCSSAHPACSSKTPRTALSQDGLARRTSEAPARGLAGGSYGRLRARLRRDGTSRREPQHQRERSQGRGGLTVHAAAPRLGQQQRADRRARAQAARRHHRLGSEHRSSVADQHRQRAVDAVARHLGDVGARREPTRHLQARPCRRADVGRLEERSSGDDRGGARRLAAATAARRAAARSVQHDARHGPARLPRIPRLF